jgi:hypothetical protein
MREELDKALCEKYAKIFRDRHGDMRSTAMCWGFDHGDGWYNIIDQLCASIQNHIDWNSPTGNPIPQVVATQVKEKFGGLRFYYMGGDDTIDGMVRMAEALSLVTCERCGAPGQTRGRGWIRTLCDVHSEQQDTPESVSH